MNRHKRKLLSAVLAGFLLFSAVIPASAASSAEIQEQIDELESQKSQLQSEMDALGAKLSDNLEKLEDMAAQKRVLDKQVFLLQESIENVNDQITAQTMRIADKQEQLDEEQARLAELNQKHKERIRAMEEAGPLSYWSVLFESRSLADFLDRVEMIRQINASDQRRLQEISDASAAVAAAQAELEEGKKDLETAKQALLDSQAALEQKSDQAQSLLQELLDKGDEYEILLNQSEQMQEQLMEEIAQKQDEFDKAAYEEWLAAQQPEEEEGTLPDNGEWLTPVPYYTLTSPFGMRLHPILGIYRMHNGVDMACAEGTPIYATRGGQVTIAMESDSAGFYVQINHGDGYQSVYMHMQYYVVSAGEYVAAGQVIGYVGNTGLSKGNHLHFGISLNGEYVNPMEYIN